MSFEVEALPATVVSWYDDPAGTALGQGNSFLPNTAGIYYAQTANDPDDGCYSELSQFVLQQDEVSVTTIANTTIGIGESISLETTASASLGSDLVFSWTSDNGSEVCRVMLKGPRRQA